MATALGVQEQLTDHAMIGADAVNIALVSVPAAALVAAPKLLLLCAC